MRSFTRTIGSNTEAEKGRKSRRRGWMSVNLGTPTRAHLQSVHTPLTSQSRLFFLATGCHNVTNSVELPQPLFRCASCSAGSGSRSSITTGSGPNSGTCSLISIIKWTLRVPDIHSILENFSHDSTTDRYAPCITYLRIIRLQNLFYFVEKTGNA